MASEGIKMTFQAMSFLFSPSFPVVSRDQHGGLHFTWNPYFGKGVGGHFFAANLPFQPMSFIYFPSFPSVSSYQHGEPDILGLGFRKIDVELILEPNLLPIYMEHDILGSWPIFLGTGSRTSGSMLAGYVETTKPTAFLGSIRQVQCGWLAPKKHPNNLVTFFGG